MDFRGYDFRGYDLSGAVFDESQLAKLARAWLLAGMRGTAHESAPAPAPARAYARETAPAAPLPRRVVRREPEQPQVSGWSPGCVDLDQKQIEAEVSIQVRALSEGGVEHYLRRQDRISALVEDAERVGVDTKCLVAAVQELRHAAVEYGRDEAARSAREHASAQAAMARRDPDAGPPIKV